MNRTRRRFLTGGAGALATATAGCLDSLGSGAPSVGGQSDDSAAATASFFTLADFARNVAGEALSVENAVPMGQHGHGWEPRSDITVEIVERDAFVHLGIEGFQRWADEVVGEIERNHEGVASIAAAEDVELSEYGGHDHNHDGGGEGSHSDDHDNESDHDHDHGDHEHGHDHGEGDYDPHVWVDPVRSRQVVETIRDGLMEADSENAETYEENAGSYLTDLEELHGRFEEGLAGRDHDTVVVAGHDSYGYLGERYGFEIHTPQGVSPETEATPSQIAETVDLIEREGIEVVLYDHFEGDSLARTIAEEAGTVRDVAALSPAESITTEWDAEGLDYVGQMGEINLPALRAALGAGS
ncbi:metal ABC transporter solute-binding protein, Zn/Mn family [Halalkalicoccus jeotgali]|uniref:ABC transporter periplasmic substrate-binding protein n=1 Tax=Halalkalicoccus jeotgali (strain DSM 18796 / CECT 7217 / JCM 14584 / KCTC 4019 / B3) TaxID=795797 RepID=D8J3I3_HALJB|nr:zinc ABC transporter substrate-binding protein [Halalkalicoccus jeotgali]ADJ15290.1 ABC-type transport system periplasmic substrate-binding protein (probable substrate zinc) [Halalkalicoccus jeotgali B3]ELY35497.1 ABC transporter periplasmic substrate-binding protein [Halalkalicoccus jeotgali B3]